MYVKKKRFKDSNTNALKLKHLISTHEPRCSVYVLQNYKSSIITLSENQTDYVIHIKVILSGASVLLSIACLPPSLKSLNLELKFDVHVYYFWSLLQIIPWTSLPGKSALLVYYLKKMFHRGIITKRHYVRVCPTCHSVPESLFACA